MGHLKLNLKSSHYTGGKKFSLVQITEILEYVTKL